jgi:hypothetical protein
VSAAGSRDIGALAPEQHGEHVEHVERVFDDEDLQASQRHDDTFRTESTIDTSEMNRGGGTVPTDRIAVQLVEAAGLRDACDLDLLLFFSRHPRVVLTSEQLAAYVGYDLVEVARALDLLLGAGLLKRTLNHGAPGRMYVLEVDHAEEWLEPLRRLCAMPDGRNALKVLLRQRRSPTGVANGTTSLRHFSAARQSSLWKGGVDHA